MCVIFKVRMMAPRLRKMFAGVTAIAVVRERVVSVRDGISMTGAKDVHLL